MEGVTCSCTAMDHPHHSGSACTKAAISQSHEVDLNQPGGSGRGGQHNYGALCLECYQILVVDVEEQPGDEMLELDADVPFPACALT